MFPVVGGRRFIPFIEDLYEPVGVKSVLRHSTLFVMFTKSLVVYPGGRYTLIDEG